MPDFLPDFLPSFMNFFRAPEAKASRTAQVLAFESGGRARWTPRDYAALAREGYLTNAIVHRAVRLIAENAASCGFLLYEGAQERDGHPLSQLLTRPNARQDGASFFEALYAHMLLAGNAYVEAVALGDQVRELYALRPDRMKVVPGADGWPEAYEYSVAGRSVRFDQLASNVPPILHLTFFHPLDDHYGLAPVEAAAVAVDAVVQIGVRDADRTAPPATPADGDRHIVATGATGAWSGHADAVAVYEDGTWRFLAPKLGWCAWSAADGALLVYDGAAWADVAGGAMSGSVAQLGINDTAIDPNLLTVRSNAALFSAITVADSGTGDMRLQISKEASAKTASVVFSDAFSGRAEFGLIGSDAFKLKVSNDGTTFIEALAIDQGSGNATFPRGLALTGVISPSQITSSQNDYNPAGIASACVLNLSSDTLRSVSGLAGGAEGRVVALVNTGSQIISLLNESASSTAANRFALGCDITIAGKQAALLRYDGTASRWYAIATTGLMGSAQPPGFTNLLVNGAGRVNMRARASNANNTFGHDRWYALTQTAAIAVSTVSNAADGVPSLMRLTQSQATAQRMGYAQVIVSADCRHLRGQQVTLSGKARLSAAHAIRYAIIEWTGTADATVRDVVNAWTNGTYTGGNFFKAASNTISGVSAISPGANTLADLTPLTVTLGSAFNNLIVMAWTESAEAQNVTLDLRLQLEAGGVASSFEMRPVTAEERLCEPFYQKSFPRGTTPANANRQANSAATCWQANTLASARIGFATKMFKTPAMTMFSPSPGSPSNGQWSALIGGGWVTGGSTGNSPDDAGFAVGLTATGAVVGAAYIIAGDWEADAEAGV